MKVLVWRHCRVWRNFALCFYFFFCICDKKRASYTRDVVTIVSVHVTKERMFSCNEKKNSFCVSAPSSLHIGFLMLFVNCFDCTFNTLMFWEHYIPRIPPLKIELADAMQWCLVQPYEGITGLQLTIAWELSAISVCCAFNMTWPLDDRHLNVCKSSDRSLKRICYCHA